MHLRCVPANGAGDGGGTWPKNAKVRIFCRYRPKACMDLCPKTPTALSWLSPVNFDQLDLSCGPKQPLANTFDYFSPAM